MSSYLRKNEGTSLGTIVLVHGNSGSSKLFDSIYSSDISHTLLAPDLPGHGMSLNGFDLSNYGFVLYRKMLTDLINSIDDDVLLVGISLGGHLLMETLDEVKRHYKSNGTPELKDFVLTFEEQQAMYVKVKVVSLKKHPLNNGTVWLFIDEILIE